MAARRGKKKRSQTFAATVAAWVKQTDRRMELVPEEAAKELAAEMRRPTTQGGNLPYVSGNLHNSLQASLSGMPPVDWTRKRTDIYPPNEADIIATIEGASLGQKMWLGFRAPYAQKIEKEHAMVRLAAQRWQQIVELAVRRVKARTGGE